MLTGPSAARAVQPNGVSIVDAPGLAAGPLITDAGLVWESSQGVMLTDPAGGSKVLAPLDAHNGDGFVDLAWFGVDQWALARPSGVFAGQIGGALSELRPLRKCNPGSPATPPGAAMYALSRGHLFAALPEPCFPTSKAPLGVVLDINLDSRHSRVLARIPGTLDGVAASGRYVALAYSSPPLGLITPPSSRTPSQEPRLFVRVLDAGTGAVVNQIPAPASLKEYGASAIQVDGRGDVLVTSGCDAVSPRQLAHIAHLVVGQSTVCHGPSDDARQRRRALRWPSRIPSLRRSRDRCQGPAGRHNANGRRVLGLGEPSLWRPGTQRHPARVGTAEHRRQRGQHRRF